MDTPLRGRAPPMHRLDKFYMLERRAFEHALRDLSSRGWEEEAVLGYAQARASTTLCNALTE